MTFAANPPPANLWSNTASKGYHGFLGRNKILGPGFGLLKR